MRWIFTVMIGLSALFIAGCAAVFSVKGLGLLFAGSAAAVMVMAASLEAGKLVAASFLYRYWHDLNIPLRIYLFTAVVVLIGITSLGIYGYLARAYETTHTSVALLEGRIGLLDQQIADAHRQIEAERARMGDTSTVDSRSLDAQQQRIVEIDKQLESSLARLEQRRADARTKLDRDIELQQQRLAEAGQMLQAGIETEQAAVAQLNERVAALDRAVDAYTKEGVAGLFKPDHVKKGQALREQQRSERDAIDSEIEAHNAAMSQHRTAHAAKAQAITGTIESLRSVYDAALATLHGEEQALRKRHTEDVAAAKQQIDTLRTAGTASVTDRQHRIDALYQQIRSHEDQTAALRQRIAETDVGTYRFVARSMGLPVDQVVKWLILVLVLVFDPLAVTLTVGFNVALMRGRRERRPSASGIVPSAAAAATDGSSGTDARVRPWATALVSLLLIGALGAGGYAMASYVRSVGDRAYAGMIPADSFAVVSLNHGDLDPAGANAHALTVGGLIPASTAARLKELAIDGFAMDRPLYLFAKYPEASESSGARDHPVLLVGLVAAIDDPVRAELGLAAFAESVAGDLLPRPVEGARRSRAMVDYGTGRYLDPEGGFFSYALTARAAVLMLEIEGDPASPQVEQAIRRCLADGAQTNRFGEATVELPARALSGRGAVTLWFDAQRCFDRMPKNTAAANRYEMLRRFLAFEAVIEIDPVDKHALRVVGDYRYAVKRFDPTRGRTPDAIATLAELGPAPDALIAGLLMDRCADTLEFESIIARLRQGLGTAAPGIAPPQIVVDKTVDSETNARFELNIVYVGEVGSPLTVSMESLRQ